MMKAICWCLLIAVLCPALVSAQPSEQRLAQWLKRFPEADANGDGRLTLEEANAYRQKLLDSRTRNSRRRSRAPREFSVDPGWQADRFPEHAVCYRTPQEIAEIYAQVTGNRRSAVISYPKPGDGALRIVGTGHSFMAPGYKTFPLIAKAAGLQQPPPLLHTGGGMTGSARYKWEQENGIFQFDGHPTPKLLASIANAKWDAMIWGPYFNDRPAYYACWIDFCLKYNPQMKFYLSDAWPQLYQLGQPPQSEAELTDAVIGRMGEEKNTFYGQLIGELNERYRGKVFLLPTSDAMVLAAKYYHRGELPGVEGLHMAIGGKARSLWRDQLGHLGPGFGNLEGYVFYATLYKRSPELIESEIPFGTGDYPSRELDCVFRKIAWQAVINNPLTGVTDKDQDGVGDH